MRRLWSERYARRAWCGVGLGCWSLGAAVFGCGRVSVPDTAESTESTSGDGDGDTTTDTSGGGSDPGDGDGDGDSSTDTSACDCRDGDGDGLGGGDGPGDGDGDGPGDGDGDTGAPDCAPGHFGTTCQACTCENGTCDDGLSGDGSCSCDSGWAGLKCDRCTREHFGSDCSACLCGSGLCDDGLQGTGACTCRAGWAGLACDICAPGYGGPLCEACAAEPALGCPCSTDGEFGCDGVAQKVRLECVSGQWALASTCSALQNCSQVDGSCANIVPQCNGQNGGYLFCVAPDQVHTCGPDLVDTTVEVCAGLCSSGLCLAPRCGDGKIQASQGEECDDSNTQP